MWTLDFVLEGTELIDSKISDVIPNLGFMVWLKNYDDALEVFDVILEYDDSIATIYVKERGWKSHK